MARTKKPDAGVLAEVELFQGLSKRELQKILSLMKELEYQAGEDVFAEGDPGGRFFLILEGTAKVKINGRTRATSGPGDYFGEMSLIDNSPRSATVTAETRLRTLALASFNFRPLLDEQPAITRKLLVETCGRLRTVQRNLVG